MSSVFVIAGPTATGKSELAVDVAVRLGGEVVNADAFQIYAGFDVLSGKPESTTLEKVPHHLIGPVSVEEEMNAAKYRNLVLPVIAEITSRGKLPLIVGGSGLYIKALTHGLVDTPSADSHLREKLNSLSNEQLRARLGEVDPVAAERVDPNNRRRLVRAIEICMLTGQPASAQRTLWAGNANLKRLRSGDLQIAETIAGRRTGDRRSLQDSSGVVVFRDRDELYDRINRRVEAMLDNGAIDEVRNAGPVSSTVTQMIGIKEIRQHLNDEISLAECTARIQQTTRRYAKRQLTWFQHQTNFEPLNLSLLSYNEALEWVTRRTIAPAHGE